MNPTYQHTQFGAVIVYSVGGAALATLGAAAITGEWLPLGPLAAVLAVTAWLFSSLNITVDDVALRWKFGPGLIRKNVPLVEITQAGVVRNPWWYGWGIHITPRGWLYNVSGMRGVQVRLRTGKQFRLGSDEPEALARAIADALARRGAA